MSNLTNKLSQEFDISIKSVTKTLALFEEGASVPFVARYRKEATEGMDDIQIRAFFERWQYLADLEKRQQQILSILEAQKNLFPSLKSAIELCETKTQLEELYAPYKTKKQSKADLARNLGLQEIAMEAWGTWEELGIARCRHWQKENNQTIPPEEILQGITEILIEEISLNSNFYRSNKQFVLENAFVKSRVIRGKKEAGEKYQDYFEYQEKIQKIPSHRILALLRGKKETILKLSIELSTSEAKTSYILEKNALQIILNNNVLTRSNLTKLQKTLIQKAWHEKIFKKIETSLLVDLKIQAEKEAINIFANNLSDLLMAAPAGNKSILGVDPGFRNGVKLAAINKGGQFLSKDIIYPHAPQHQSEEAKQQLLNIIQRHQIEYIAIGNGTASRETQALVTSLIKEHQLSCIPIIVNEAGASVYSASPIASEEFPQLDVTIRGAISIARRLQDPLAELVKIDPQAIGIGQYQHDLKPNELLRSLKAVVEDCVNRIGVDINLASKSLLTYVSGLTPKLAENIIDYRESIGAFRSRNQILKVPGIGNKCFEQCAGFLRIQNPKQPLDASGVHPESYWVAESLCKKLGQSTAELLKSPQLLESIPPHLTETIGADAYTLEHVIHELKKPGRDPRPKFQYAQFDEAVHSIDDLITDMIIEGTITNVAAFGAFVDIGVHQDGLIHISQLTNRFVKDPRDIVRVGQIVKVKVLEVDSARRRISLKGIEL